MKHLFAIIVLLVLVPRVTAQVPELMNYQGRLVDGGGLVNSNVEIVLRLESESGGALYAETQTVLVVDGLYTFCLGESNGAPGTLSAALMTTGVWVVIQINGHTLSPREQVKAVSYAQRAAGVTDGTITAADLNASVAGNGLTGGAGTSLAVGTSSTIVVSADGVSVADDSIDGAQLADTITLDANLTLNAGDLTVSDDLFVGSSAETLDHAGFSPDGDDLFVAGSAGIEGTIFTDSGLIVGASTTYADNQVTQGDAGEGLTIDVAGGDAAGEDLTVIANNVIAGAGGNAVSGGTVGGTIAGGTLQTVGSDYGTIGGGQNNAASGVASTVGGGGRNTATGDYATVAGGWTNRALGRFSTVSGGERNLASGSSAVVVGGRFSRAAGDVAIAGGEGCSASAYAISLGLDNFSGAYASAIVGGDDNTITNTEYAFIGGGQQNVVGGGTEYSAVIGGLQNQVTANAQQAVILAGSKNRIDGFTASADNAAIAGGEDNSVKATHAFVGAGQHNTISTSATHSSIGGGQDNSIGPDATHAVVAGGLENAATNVYAVVAGGRLNTAGGQYSFAAGHQANAIHDGALVWADSQNAVIASTNTDSVVFRCQGGVRFTSGGAGANQTVQWFPGDAAWSVSSDRNLKEDIAALDTQEVLDKVAALPLATWRYRGYPQQHIGPMAQDFHAAFALGRSDTRIDGADIDGVALAAIQGLAKQNEELRSMNDALRARMAEMELRVAALEAR